MVAMETQPKAVFMNLPRARVALKQKQNKTQRLLAAELKEKTKINNKNKFLDLLLEFYFTIYL